MANPFLMTEDDLSPNSSDLSSNPFLMEAPSDGEFSNDNPFFAQASNPFAFGEPAPVEAVDIPADSSKDNVFCPTTVDNTGNMFMNENVIATTSASSSSITNTGQIDSAMSFFGTTITDMEEHEEPALAPTLVPAKPANLLINKNMIFDDNTAYSSEDELTNKAGPPPRPVPPSKTTQDLISSVADQLDQTSSHLLGRIPATRTPSPVSMRDLHSPCDFGDLLDVSDGHPSGDFNNQCDDLQTNDFMSQSVANDNPFAMSSEIPAAVNHEVPSIPAAHVEPMRPPPPRPTPPRPTPPQRPSPPSAVPNITPQPVAHHGPPPPRPAPVHHNQHPPVPAPPQQKPSAEPDLFDMFGIEESPKPKKPPPPKSNQDILSLFSTTTSSAPVQSSSAAAPVQNDHDLLSGDILSLDTDAGFGGPLMSDGGQVPFPIANINSQNVYSSAPASEVITATTTTTASIIPISSSPPESSNNIPLNIDNNTAQIETTMVDNVTEIIEQPLIEAQPTAMVIEIIPPTGQHQSIVPTQLTPTSERDNFLDEVESSEHSGIDTISINENVASFIQSSDKSDEQMDTTIDFNAITPVPSVNPFASPEAEDEIPSSEILATDAVTNIFGLPSEVSVTNVTQQQQQPQPPPPPVRPRPPPVKEKKSDEFDAFAAKFDSVKKDDNLLGSFAPPTRSTSSEFAWGDNDQVATAVVVGSDGFGNDEGFDDFLAMGVPQVQESQLNRNDSHDSDDNIQKEFNVFIRPKDTDIGLGLITPILAPPPKGSQNNSIYSGDSSPRVNPFDKGDETGMAESNDMPERSEIPQMERTDSQETPPTPLFDDDVSQPLEDFPRITYEGTGWEMQLRQPNKKKITGQRFWKKIWVQVVYQGDNPVIQLKNSAKDKEPFQELPLQACYSISEISAQQFDQFGKIFTVKLQYIFYKERPGVRPGQVTKAERLTNKLSQFAAYAIQGDYQGVKEFGSDLKKLGLPVEHAPQVSQLFKIGSHTYEDLKIFSSYMDELLFKFNVHRDRALTYKSEEVQLTAVDEIYVEQDAEGRVMKQIARVRLFFLGFLSGMPTIELGLNDMWRQGKEVVGRHDIIPVVTEEWIRLEGVEFHSCVQQNEYERSRTIRFQPPDACYIELMRFRVRPPKNRELPFQLKAVWCVTGNKVELRADVLVPGFASRKLGQIPCEDVSIRFPIPECWIYLFRVEKHFRYGSVKSAHRRTGKIKGIERILGTVDQLQESLIEVTSGQAKYEHHHRAIVWRCPRLPKEGQGAYTTHQLVVRMALTSYDQIPEQLAPYCFVEFTMPATQVSHVTVRSVSVQDSDSDDPPEKYVRYLARHEYRVGIEHTTGESMNPYLAATAVSRAPPVKEIEPPAPAAPSLPAIAGSDSDSDSN